MERTDDARVERLHGRFPVGPLGRLVAERGGHPLSVDPGGLGVVLVSPLQPHDATPVMRDVPAQASRLERLAWRAAAGAAALAAAAAAWVLVVDRQHSRPAHTVAPADAAHDVTDALPHAQSPHPPPAPVEATRQAPAAAIPTPTPASGSRRSPSATSRPSRSVEPAVNARRAEPRADARARPVSAVAPTQARAPAPRSSRGSAASPRAGSSAVELVPVR